MKNFTLRLLALGLTAACFAGCLTACKAKAPAGGANAPAQQATQAEQSNDEGEGKMITGGWTVAESTEITEEQKKFFNDAVGQLDGYFYTPVALLATQVVSGRNYVFLCKSTVEANSAARTMKYTYIYVDLQGKAKFMGDKDLALPGVDGEQKSGGWEMATDTTISEDIKKVVDKATETLTGATYEPVAYIGSQVVAGKNHAILCMSTPSVKELNGAASYVLITIYEDLQGKCEITETKDVDLKFG